MRMCWQARTAKNVPASAEQLAMFEPLMITRKVALATDFGTYRYMAPPH